jgi:hypothetical protein
MQFADRVTSSRVRRLDHGLGKAASIEARKGVDGGRDHPQPWRDPCQAQPMSGWVAQSGRAAIFKVPAINRGGLFVMGKCQEKAATEANFRHTITAKKGDPI